MVDSTYVAFYETNKSNIFMFVEKWKILCNLLNWGFWMQNMWANTDGKLWLTIKVTERNFNKSQNSLGDSIDRIVYNAAVLSISIYEHRWILDKY